MARHAGGQVVDPTARQFGWPLVYIEIGDAAALRALAEDERHPHPAKAAPVGEEACHMAPPDLTGYLCEQCLDAPAVAFVAAPWGGEMGVCAPCGGLEPAVPSAASGAVSDCPLCTQPPGRDEDVHVYLQHCVATGHPVRGRGSWRGNAPLIMRPGVSLRFFER